jgi:LPS O-antigen subunit length determinant protein (WzzB/FepE family)
MSGTRLGKMKKKTKIAIIVSIVIIAVVAVLVIWDVPGKKVEFIIEKIAIEKVTNAYFKAEMERDFKQVYAYLAPSSSYKKTHSYEQFVKDVGSSPVRIETYRIIDVYQLRDNDDRDRYPLVDKFVQVEIDVDIRFTDTGAKSTYNYNFTFLKEKGVWYKG